MIYLLVGANKGQKIPKFLKSYGSIVYAIEACPDNVRFLKADYGNDPRVIIIPKAAWVYEGEIVLKLYKSSLSHSLYDRGPKYIREEGEQKVTVPCMDFSAFLKDMRVDFMRMNIEGAECEVLLKCLKEGTLDNVERMEVDIHAHKIPSLEGLEKELRSELAKWDPNGGRYKLWGKA